MLFFKSTSTPVAPGVFVVDIAAKPPGKTFAVCLALDADALPSGLLTSLEGMGFKRTVSKPYVHQDGTKILDLQYTKVGTDIFEGWTTAEKEANLAKLTELFASLGVTIAPRVMSLAEAF